MTQLLRSIRPWILGVMLSCLVSVSGWMGGGLIAQAQPDLLHAAERYFGSGIQLYQAGQLYEAQHALEQALQLNPSQVDAHNTLGIIKAQQGDPASALQEFRAELSLNPQHPNRPQILHNIGNSLLAMGEIEAAIQAFETALKQDPRLVESYISLASALHHSGQDSQAKEHLIQALKLDPKNPRANHDLAVLERHQDPQSALQRLNLVVSLKPQWAEAHNSLAITLIQLREFEAAVTEFRVALLWDPTPTVIRQNLQQLLRLLEPERILYC